MHAFSYLSAIKNIASLDFKSNICFNASKVFPSINLDIVPDIFILSSNFTQASPFISSSVTAKSAISSKNFLVTFDASIFIAFIVLPKNTLKSVPSKALVTS